MHIPATLGIALAIGLEACVIALAVISYRNLRRLGARTRGLAFVIGATILATINPLVWLAGAGLWSSVPCVPLLLAAFTPNLVVTASGRRPRWELASALQAMTERLTWNPAAEAGGVADADREWLITMAGRLDSWREPATSELVDLWKQKVFDVVNPDPDEDRETFVARAGRRNERIAELLPEFWAGTPVERRR